MIMSDFDVVHGGELSGVSTIITATSVLSSNSSSPTVQMSKRQSDQMVLKSEDNESVPVQLRRSTRKILLDPLFRSPNECENCEEDEQRKRPRLTETSGQTGSSHLLIHNVIPSESSLSQAVSYEEEEETSDDSRSSASREDNFESAVNCVVENEMTDVLPSGPSLDCSVIVPASQPSSLPPTFQFTPEMVVPPVAETRRVEIGKKGEMIGTEPGSLSRADLEMFARLFRRVSGVVLTNPATSSSDFISLEENGIGDDDCKGTQTETVQLENGTETDHVGVVPLDAGWTVQLAVVKRSTGTTLPPPTVLRIPESESFGNCASATLSSSGLSDMTLNSSEASYIQLTVLENQLKDEMGSRIKLQERLNQSEVAQAALAKYCTEIGAALSSLQSQRRIYEEESKLEIDRLKAELNKMKKIPNLCKKLQSQIDELRQSKRELTVEKNGGPDEIIHLAQVLDNGDGYGTSVERSLAMEKRMVNCSFPSMAPSIFCCSSGISAETNDSDIAVVDSPGPPTQSRWKCSECGKICDNRSALRHHLNRVHTPPSKILHCRFCNAPKKRKDDLRVHERTCLKKGFLEKIM